MLCGYLHKNLLHTTSMPTPTVCPNRFLLKQRASYRVETGTSGGRVGSQEGAVSLRSDAPRFDNELDGEESRALSGDLVAPIFPCEVGLAPVG